MPLDEHVEQLRLGPVGASPGGSMNGGARGRARSLAMATGLHAHSGGDNLSESLEFA